MERICTINYDKPLVLIPSEGHAPLVGVTKSETDKITGITKFYLGDKRTYYHPEGYNFILLGTYENGEIIYNTKK